jgi:spermine synthase
VKNLQLFIEDAQEYVKNTSERYDSIIVDIFQDDQMPSFLFAPSFFLQLNTLLNSNGVILFNTIVKNKSQAQRNRDFVQYFQNTYQITVFPKVKQENQLLLLAKQNLNSSIKK